MRVLTHSHFMRLNLTYSHICYDHVYNDGLELMIWWFIVGDGLTMCFKMFLKAGNQQEKYKKCFGNQLSRRMMAMNGRSDDIIDGYQLIQQFKNGWNGYRLHCSNGSSWLIMINGKLTCFFTCKGLKDHKIGMGQSPWLDSSYHPNEEDYSVMFVMLTMVLTPGPRGVGL